MSAKPIPDGYHSVTPYLIVSGAAQALNYYKTAFGAKERMRFAGPDGKIGHAEIEIGGSVIMLGDPDHRLYDEPKALGSCTAGLHIFSDDNAAMTKRAVDAGCELVQPPTDMFYGASSASVRDPFGHVWVLLTWKEDLEPAAMEARARDALG